MIPDWAKEMNCAVTVCDKEGIILYMNDKAKETFALRGADEQIYWDTFSDFRYKLMECKEVHDRDGYTKTITMYSCGCCTTYLIAIECYPGYHLI